MEPCEDDGWRRFNRSLHIAVQNVREYPESTDIIFELDNILGSFAKPGMIERKIQQEVQAEIHKYREEIRRRNTR